MELGAAPAEASAPPGVPDIIGPGLDVLFCGINPGALSGATGQHFARPGNRFWPALHRSGLTERQLGPADQDQLLEMGLGITNLVARTTASAAEVARVELEAGALRLEALARQWRPRAIAVLGVLAYRRAFRKPKASIGRQPDDLGPAGLWVLPNPSGLQARYQLPELVELFAALRPDRAGEGPRRAR